MSASAARLWRFFFFQAEDGIRDYKVTGVQTCALPISCGSTSTSGIVAILVFRKSPTARAPGPPPAALLLSSCCPARLPGTRRPPIPPPGISSGGPARFLLPDGIRPAAGRVPAKILAAQTYDPIPPAARRVFRAHLREACAAGSCAPRSVRRRDRLPR